MGNRVVVVRTGIANLASVLAAFNRLGVEPVVSADAAQIEDASHVVLPGVGSFGPAVSELMSRGLGDVLKARVEEERPTLAICLGMQLLCASSEEAPGAAGLGLVPAPIERFRANVRIPQIGWNEITPTSGCEMLQRGYVYFANSYRLAAAPPGWHAAIAHHGEDFVAAVERGGVLACQFHPELSGEFGCDLLSRWLAREDCGC